MEIKVLENTARIVRVSVELPVRTTAKDRNLFVATNNVRTELLKEGVDVVKWTATTSCILNNFGTNAKLQGEWVFEKHPSLKSPPVSNPKERKERVNDIAAKPASKARKRKRPAPRKEDKLLRTENLE